MSPEIDKVKAGDLVTHEDDHDLRRVGVVVRVDPDWMRAWSNVWVLWHGEATPVQHAIRTLKLFT